MKTVLVVVGSGEELIKLGPVIRLLRDQYSAGISARWLQASAEPDSIWEVGALFNLAPDYEMDLAAYPIDSVERSWALSNGFAHELDRLMPDLVIVQGASQTALLAAQQAFIRRIPVLDIQDEVGASPRLDYGRQINRKMLCALASFHCVPNPSMATRLRGDGFPFYEIGITGDPIVDAMRWIQQGRGASKPLQLGLRAAIPLGRNGLADRTHPDARVLVAMQASTRWSQLMTALALAVANLSHDHSNMHFVVALDAQYEPPHDLYSILSSIPNVSVRVAASPTDLLTEVLAADLVVTDSMLVVDESEAIGRPVIAVHEAQSFALSRHDPELEQVQDWIAGAIRRAIADGAVSGQKNLQKCTLGDGLASQRIGRLISNWARNQSLTARAFEPFAPETHGRRVQWVGIPTLSEQSVTH